MNPSTRVLLLFSLPLITVFTVSCAQPGVGERAFPTSPSSLSVGPSATALGPGASYVATGSWHLVFHTTNGTFLGEDDVNLIQDTNGNLTIEGNPDITFTRRPGTGAALIYAVDSFEGRGLCDERYSGVVVIFTQTNTLRGTLTGTESDCVKLQISITGTKN